MVQKRKPAVIQPKVRLREDLHRRLAQAAKKAGRSLNQEIVQRLEKSFEAEGVAELLAQANNRYAEAGRTYGAVLAALEKAGVPAVLSPSAEPMPNQTGELPKRAEERNK